MDGDGSALPEVVHALAWRRKHRRFIRNIAVVGDVAAIVLAFALGALIRYVNPVDVQARNLLVVIVPAYLIVAVSQHAYVITNLARARDSALKACGALLLSIGLVGLISFLLQTTGDVSRGVFAMGATLAILFVALFRTWLANYPHRVLGQVTTNEVVIQDSVQAKVQPGSILLDAAMDGIALRLDSPAMLDRLGHCLHAADRVIVFCPPERRPLWANALKSSNINGEILTEELNEIGAIGFGSYNGSMTLTVAAAPLSGSDLILKRVFDLVVASLALVLLTPGMLLVALAIKVDSRGPIFFRQPRIGLGNRVFHMYKFRSMRVAQGDVTGGQSTSRNDSRVTRVGQFIRKTSVDEIPQLFNVLIGDMSIVGPRPHPLESKAEAKLFWDIDRRYWQRHAVKPGMTGLAQIRGFRGATEKEADLTNRLQADLEYVSGWSIWRDMGIIIATFRVLTHSNAY